MEAKDIQTALLAHYFQHDHIYSCTNFQGAGYHEADLLTVSRALMVYEFEAKVSRSDFFADFKKTTKHDWYKAVFNNKAQKQVINGLTFEHAVTSVPNHLYYCCPKEMIRPDEVPEYAGLIWLGYIHGELEFAVIKKAPVLHRAKATQGLINRICQTLSTRAALKSSLQTFRRNQRALTTLRRQSEL